mmetsp:Transcript_4581/g.6717  ORF Transcript_4581/g.6717 Transcript_4581/m.6717 type:complete len:404 (-) Transcript_4581:464-1675(-)
MSEYNDLLYANGICDYRPTYQWIAIKVASASSGTLSSAGSLIIIYMIFKGVALLEKVQYRLILAMSAFDILQSISLGLATLPIPRDSACTLYALGNKASCMMQAFSFQLGFVVPNYVAMLCIYYMCTIKYNIQDGLIRKYESYMHLYAILPPLTIAITALSNDLFNNFCTMCWLAASDAYDISKIQNEEDNGDDDDQGSLLLTLLSFATVFFVIIDFGIIFWCMIQVRRSMRMSRSQSQLMAYYTVSEAKIQANLYVIAFLVTYLIPISIFCVVAFSNGSSPFPLLLLQAIFQPLQGFWNFFTFIRPKFKMITDANPEKTYCQRLCITVFRSHAAALNSPLRFTSRRGTGRRIMLRPGQTPETAEIESSTRNNFVSSTPIIGTDVSERVLPSSIISEDETDPN